MIYLFVLTFCSLYLLSIKGVKNNSLFQFFLISMPLFYIYFIFPAVQFDVGTDYFSYSGIYSDPDHLSVFERKGEYLFVILYEIALYFKLGSQFIFFAASFINSVLFVIILYLLKKNGYKEWLIFIVFFTVTGIYHNQMNGLRQYVTVMSLPIAVVLVFYKQYWKFSFLFAFSRVAHTFAIFHLLIFPIIYLNKLSRNKKVLLFFVMPFIIVFLMEYVEYIVNNYMSFYAHYLELGYGEPIPFTSLLSKLIYLPLFFVFLYFYCCKPEFFNQFTKLMDLNITIFIVTYWMLLISLYYGFGYRLSMMFIFFYIFPIYHLLDYLLTKKKIYSFTLLLLCILTPYVFKVIVSSSGEFSYAWYL